MKNKKNLILTLVFTLLFIFSNDKIYIYNISITNFENEVNYCFENIDKKDEKKYKKNNNKYHILKNLKEVKIKKIIFKFFIFSYNKIYGRNNLKYLE